MKLKKIISQNDSSKAHKKQRTTDTNESWETTLQAIRETLPDSAPASPAETEALRTTKETINALANNLLTVCETKAPGSLDIYNPGASLDQIAAFETHINSKLPWEYRFLLMSINGNTGFSQISGYAFDPIERVTESWNVISDARFNSSQSPRAAGRYGDDYSDDDSYGYSEDDQDIQYNSPAIQAVLDNKKWIPIFSDGAGNHLCIDMDPTDQGDPGQIISYEHDSGFRDVIYPGITDLLEDFIKKAERNELIFDRNTGWHGIPEDSRSNTETFRNQTLQQILEAPAETDFDALYTTEIRRDPALHQKIEDALEKSLKQPDPVMHMKLVKAVAAIRKPNRITPIIDAYRHPNWSIPIGNEQIEVLTNIGDSVIKRLSDKLQVNQRQNAVILKVLHHFASDRDGKKASNYHKCMVKQIISKFFQKIPDTAAKQQLAQESGFTLDTYQLN